MITYSFVMGLLLLGHFYKIKDNYNEKSFNIAIIVLFLISGFRYQVGTDYQHMLNVYNVIKNGNSYTEFGYELLNKLIQINPLMNEYWLFLVISGIIIFPLSWYIKRNTKKENWFLALYFYVATGIFFASFNLIRQYISIIIVLVGSEFLKKENILGYIKYCLCVLFAMMFHTSALIAFPYLLSYILFKKDKFNKILLSVYICSLVLLVFDIRFVVKLFEFIIPNRWQWYLESGYFINRNTSAVVKQLVPNLLFIFSFIYKKDINKISDNFDIYYQMMFLCVCITNCFYGMMVLLRFSYYFDISFIFIIPIILDFIKRKFSNKIFICFNICLIGYYLLLTIVTIFIMNGHGAMPYRTIFDLSLDIIK